jgi:hypothetical protein
VSSGQSFLGEMNSISTDTQAKSDIVGNNQGDALSAAQRHQSAKKFLLRCRIAFTHDDTGPEVPAETCTDSAREPRHGGFGIDQPLAVGHQEQWRSGGFAVKWPALEP